MGVAIDTALIKDIENATRASLENIVADSYHLLFRNVSEFRTEDGQHRSRSCPFNPSKHRSRFYPFDPFNPFNPPSPAKNSSFASKNDKKNDKKLTKKIHPAPQKPEVLNENLKIVLPMKILKKKNL